MQHQLVAIQTHYISITRHAHYEHMCKTLRTHDECKTKTVFVQYEHTTNRCKATKEHHECSTNGIPIPYECNTNTIQHEYGDNADTVRIPHGNKTDTTRIQCACNTSTTATAIRIQHEEQNEYHHNTVPVKKKCNDDAIRKQHEYNTKTSTLRIHLRAQYK